MSEATAQITGELVSRGPLVQTVLMKAFLEPHGWVTDDETSSDRIFYAPEDDVRVEHLINSLEVHATELGIASLFENNVPTMSEVLQGLSDVLPIDGAELASWKANFEPPDEYQDVDMATSIDILRAFGQASNIIRAEEMGAYWSSPTRLDNFGGHALVASENFSAVVGTQRLKDLFVSIAEAVDGQENDDAAAQLSAFVAHVSAGISRDKQQADVLRRLAKHLLATAEDVLANSEQEDEEDDYDAQGPSMG